MYARADGVSVRAITRLVVLASLVLGACLAFAAAASAQTGFQASVSAVGVRPQPCPNGAFFCGTASTNYGPATWTWTLVGGSKISNACTTDDVMVTFELGDGSTLALDESGIVCEPGNAFSAPGSAKSYGNPFTIINSWTVQSADGQFAGVTGAGTDQLHAAGARVTGTYAQTP